MSRFAPSVAALLLVSLFASCGNSAQKATQSHVSAGKATTTVPVSPATPSTSDVPEAQPEAPDGGAGSSSAETAFGDLPGYQYGEVADVVLDQIRLQLEDEALLSDVVLSMDARWLSKSGANVAMALVLELDAGVTANAGAGDDFLGGLTSKAVGSERLTVAGQPAIVGRDQDGSFTVGVFTPTLGFVVFGADRAEVIAAAEALVGTATS